MCRRPLLLWGFGYSTTDRLVHLLFGTCFATMTIRHVAVSPHTSLPGPDWCCLWYESIYPTIYARTYASADVYCWQRVKICTRSALAYFLCHVRLIYSSTVRCRLLQCGLLVHVYRHHLVGCCYAVGRHLWVLLLPSLPPSRRCFSGGCMATSSTTVLLSGVSSWQHPPRRLMCGGY